MQKQDGLVDIWVTEKVCFVGQAEGICNGNCTELTKKVCETTEA